VNNTHWKHGLKFNGATKKFKKNLDAACSDFLATKASGKLSFCFFNVHLWCPFSIHGQLNHFILSLYCTIRIQAFSNGQRIYLLYLWVGNRQAIVGQLISSKTKLDVLSARFIVNRYFKF
jgi:hypothetical protein